MRGKNTNEKVNEDNEAVMTSTTESLPALDESCCCLSSLPFLVLQILRYVECFCGPNIMAMHTDWINHSSSAQMEAAAQASLDTQSQVIPRIEELFLHQDLFSLPFRPADRIVCLWAPFQESTSPTSDSLQSFVSIPGSHKSSELLTIDSEETVIYEPLPQALESLTTVRKQVLLNAGDVVLYHPLLRHATPSQSRLGSFSTFFASSECHYIEYLHGRTEELIPDHLKTIGNMPVTPEVILSHV
jgi:phytanoyl-CoA hydroxylase